jgi:MFS transporter, MHS family, proline/betaine transporter
LWRYSAVFALTSTTCYVCSLSVPALLTSAGSLTQGNALWFSNVAAVAVTVVTLVFGHLSYVLGRKVALGVLAACRILFPIGIYALMASR